MTATPRPGSRRRAPRSTADSRIAEFIRWSNVETARARVAAGWYERHDVKSRLVDALLEEMRRRPSPAR
jgi:hypothetical protein